MTGDSSREDATVHLAVAHDRNRRLLERALSETYDVTTGGVENTAFDACIVDKRAFERSWDTLRERVRTADPVFLPVLLLTPDGDRLGADAWDVVADVIETPVRRHALRHRLGTLLDYRRLTRRLDHRRAREAERFRALFESAPDPIVLTTPGGETTAANEAFRDAFDVPEGSLIGRPLSALGYDAAARAEAVLRRAEGDTVERERFEWAARGDRLVTELHAGAVSPVGATEERVGVFHDVTDVVEREELLAKQNERLETFAGMLAHDLRNPLTLAIGYLDAAREDGDAEHFDTVETALCRIEELLDEAVTLAHHGETVIDPDTCDLSTVAETAWTHVDTDDATLSADTGLTVDADESRLTELFENLFRNAVEHGSPSSHSQARENAVEHGSPSSRARGDDVDDAGARGGSVAVRVGDLANGEGFFVADDGPGVPAADREDLFEIGYTTADDGTGFGLAIVRQIVDAHGWTVTVTDSESGGARFEFRFSGVAAENETED
ncbi:ATP-binding protein [Halocalculus aciditolerans]|uniref:histidine kinase n=1 Tax=Halocalculus aciditolerans TaxID=1383812 RepID=A0A830F618_9EURY|nr:ATP-binding protein [Halocalculus aciditolerans]GGL66798.1 hypothetical protein GCM10009039_25980 [Halocalculus aciditolerans]